MRKAVEVRGEALRKAVEVRGETARKAVNDDLGAPLF